MIDLTNIQNGHTRRKEIIRDMLPVPAGSGFVINYLIKLKSLYELARQKAIKEHPEAFERTVHEKEFERYIRSMTKKEYVSSALIGSHVVDFLFPQHKLVIEIDGDVHLREHKMRKDCQRDKNLMDELGIPVLTIDNHEIQRGRKLLDAFFKQNSRNQNSTVKRLWAKLYANTVIHYFSVEEISDHFNLDFTLILKRLRDELGEF